MQKDRNTNKIYIAYHSPKTPGKSYIYDALKKTKKLVKDEMKNVDRFITLSPLTPIATHFHIKHGAKLVNINATSQNFEYDFN